MTAEQLSRCPQGLGGPVCTRIMVVKHGFEHISPFILANLKWLPSIYALEQLNLLTLLFPATTTAVNTAIISVVLVHRAQLQGAPRPSITRLSSASGGRPSAIGEPMSTSLSPML